jgi:hypothetical protein
MSRAKLIAYVKFIAYIILFLMIMIMAIVFYALLPVLLGWL